jgi:8-oxo-dGTP diphosphatase
MSSPAAAALGQHKISADFPVSQSGAYAVILDREGRVLTVSGEAGRCYLPGGRLEPGETPRQALIRELAEECGWSAAILSPLRQSSQRIMGGAVLLRASHWRARLVAQLDAPPECENEWLDIGQALSRLHREVDRAALRAATRHSPAAARPQLISV